MSDAYPISTSVATDLAQAPVEATTLSPQILEDQTMTDTQNQYAHHLAQLFSAIAEASNLSCALMTEVMTVLARERDDPSPKVLEAIALRAAKVKDSVAALETQAVVRHSDDSPNLPVIRKMAGLLFRMTDQLHCYQHGYEHDDAKPWLDIAVPSARLSDVLEAALAVASREISAEWGDERDPERGASFSRMHRFLTVLHSIARNITAEGFAIDGLDGLAPALAKIKSGLGELSTTTSLLHEDALRLGDTLHARRQKMFFAEVEDLLGRRGDTLLRDFPEVINEIDKLMAQYRSSRAQSGVPYPSIAQALVDRSHKHKTAPADLSLQGVDAFCGVKSELHKVCEYLETGDRCTCPWRVRFIGDETDVELARSLYQALTRALEAQARALHNDPRYQQLDASGRRQFIKTRIDAEAEEAGYLLEDLAAERERTYPEGAHDLKKALVEDAFEKVSVGLR